MNSQVWWQWSDAWVFIGVFLGVRIAFISLATKAIIALIPEGSTCLTCGEETQPLAHEGGWRLLGHRFHRRFCLSCGWEGVARSTPQRAKPRPLPPTAPRASREPARH